MSLVDLCLCVLSCFGCIRLCATLWTVACQAPLSMGFSRQEYWSRVPCPPQGDLPDPGIEPEPMCLTSAQADGFFTTSTMWEAPLLTLGKSPNLSMFSCHVCNMELLRYTTQSMGVEIICSRHIVSAEHIPAAVDSGRGSWTMGCYF